MGHTRNCQSLFYNSWGYIGSSQSNSCKLSFSKISSCLINILLSAPASAVLCFSVSGFNSAGVRERLQDSKKSVDFRILDLWCHACVMRCAADRILGFDGDAHHIFKGRNLKGQNFVILCFVAMVRMQVWFFVQHFLWMLYDDLDLTRSWNVVQCGNVKASDEVMNLSKFFMYTIWCLYLSLLLDTAVFFSTFCHGGLSHASAMLSDGHEHSLTYKLMIILRKFDQDAIFGCWTHVHDEFWKCVFQFSDSQPSYCVALDSADPTNRFAVLRREVGPSENPNLSLSSVQPCHWMKFYTKKRSGEARKLYNNQTQNLGSHASSPCFFDFICSVFGLKISKKLHFGKVDHLWSYFPKRDDGDIENSDLVEWILRPSTPLMLTDAGDLAFFDLKSALYPLFQVQRMGWHCSLICWDMLSWMPLVYYDI